MITSLFTPISILSAISFYIIPTIIGRPILKLFNKKSEIKYPFIFYFITGSLLIYLSALIIHYVFPTFAFIPTFKYTVLGMLFISIIGNIFSAFDDFRIKNIILPFALSALLSLCTYLVWQIQSPYPFNWDIYEHQTLLNNLFQNKFSFFNSQITDTFGFDGYSSIFHTLMLTSQLWIKPEIISYWHSISIIHAIFVTAAAYLLAFELTKKRTAGIIAALMSAFFFDSTVSFSTLFFLPQTFTAVLFAYILTSLIASFKEKLNFPLFLLLLNVLFLFINHYIIGTASILILLVIYFYLYFYSTINKLVSPIIWPVISIFISIILFFILPMLPLEALNSGEGASFNFSYDRKFEIMKQVFGYFLLFLLPISLYALYERKKPLGLFLGALLIGLITIVAAQFPYALKFFILTRIFIICVSSIGTYWLVQKFNPVLKIISIILFGISLSTIFIINSFNWKADLKYHNIYSHISPLELEAATFIKENYNTTDTLIISDPATQYILETFSGVNSQGGAYMNKETRTHLIKVWQDNNPNSIKNNLLLIEDALEPYAKKRLYVISGRYFLWQNSTLEDRQSLAYNIWYPVDMSTLNLRYVDELGASSEEFKLVFQNQNLAIFETTP